MAGLMKLLRAFYDNVRTLRKLAKVLAVVVVCLLAVFLIMRGTITVVYKVKLGRALARYEALGGSTDLAKYAASLEPVGETDASRKLQAAGLLISRLPRRTPQMDKDDFASPSLTDPDKVNMAVDDLYSWEGFIEYHEVVPGLDERLHSRGKPWNPQWLPYLEQYLESNAVPLALIKDAAADGRGSFPVEWDRPLEASMRHLSMLRSEARLLRVDAAVRAARGDTAGAFEDARLMLRLCRFINNDPSLISWLVAMAIDRMACSTIHGCLEFATPDRETATALQMELYDRPSMYAFGHVFVGEAATGLMAIDKAAHDTAYLKEVLNAYDSGMEGGSDKGLFDRIVPWLWIVPADKYYFLEAMIPQIEAARKPFPDCLAYKESPSAGERMIWPFYLDLAARRVGSAFSRVLPQAAARNARAALAGAALGLALYKADNGRYPESLQSPLYARDVLVPPMDPFTDARVHYAVRGDGYVLYSVGANGIDDGGLSGGNSIDVGDITWEMAR